MVTSAVAALAAFSCGYLLTPAGDGSLLRLGRSRRATVSAARLAYDGANGRLVVAGGVSAATLAVALGGLRALLVMAAASAVAGLLARHLRQRRGRQAERRRRGEVIAVCDAAAADLRAGVSVLRAVERSCAPVEELSAVVAAARLGGDVPEALRRCSTMPGAAGLRAVAAAWDVAGHSGAALASVLDRVAEGLRSDEDARAEVEASLEAPRATARMLAALPLGGLALGSSIGAHPLHFLLFTPAGLVCLSLGAVLATCGVWWVERLARAVED